MVCNVYIYHPMHMYNEYTYIYTHINLKFGLVHGDTEPASDVEMDDWS